MSHYALVNVTLKNVNKNVLKEALKLLARNELGITPIIKENTTVLGFSLKKNVDLLLEYRLLYGNGYGIKITKDGFEVCVDDHGAPLTGQEFASKLKQYYVAMSTIIAARKQGYKVALQKKHNKLVVVAYA